MTGNPAPFFSSTLATNKPQHYDPSSAKNPLTSFHPQSSRLNHTGSTSNAPILNKFDNSDTTRTNGLFTAPSPASPRDIPRRPGPQYGLITPPLTPEENTVLPRNSSAGVQQTDVALEFVTNIFPLNGAAALPFARSVSVSSPTMNTTFDGVVLELPGHVKTLYVDGRNAANVHLRESIVALLELADESLQCTALIIALEKQSPSLRSVLHSLMYVGGTVVTKPPFRVNPSMVLVGMEI